MDQSLTRVAVGPLLALALLLGPISVFAQEIPKQEDPEASYTRTINNRAQKIIATLGIADTAKAARVQAILTEQYRHLREIHAARDTQISAIKTETGGNKAATDAKIQAAQQEIQTRLDTLHQEFLAKLAVELTPEEIEGIKDGMTYGVLPLTYRVYLEMLPDLTEVQKAQILTWLKEAREKAMDAGTAQEKHAWFGKYKGRINNYLSAAGYNMKQAERDYLQRQRDAAKKPR